MTHIPSQNDIEEAKRYLAFQKAKRDGSAALSLRRVSRTSALMAACPGIASANTSLYMDLTDDQFQAALEGLKRTPKAASGTDTRGGSALINNARNR